MLAPYVLPQYNDSSSNNNLILHFDGVPVHLLTMAIMASM
jgi:hypothetical protein